MDKENQHHAEGCQPMDTGENIQHTVRTDPDTGGTEIKGGYTMSRRNAILWRIFDELEEMSAAELLEILRRIRAGK